MERGLGGVIECRYSKLLDQVDFWVGGGLHLDQKSRPNVKRCKIHLQIPEDPEKQLCDQNPQYSYASIMQQH